MFVVSSLGSGRYSDCFKVSDPSHGRVIALKISYYQEATIRAFARARLVGNTNAALTAKERDAVSVSMAMAEVARQLSSCGVTPHFVKVYCEADIKNLPHKLRRLLASRLPTLTANQFKYSHVCLMQLFSCTFTSFLKRATTTDDILRPLIFQVVYTVACLQNLLPGFRHNDLSTNNVLVKPWTHSCAQYRYESAFFCLKTTHMAALSDFDFTHVPKHEVLSNERVLGGKYKITVDHNPSYDMHLFLKSVSRCLPAWCKATRAFIQGLRLDQSVDRLAHVLPQVIPAKLLAHPYFCCLRSQACRASAQFAMPS